MKLGILYWYICIVCVLVAGTALSLGAQNGTASGPATAPAEVWGNTTDGFRLGITPPEKKIAGGYALVVTIRLQNVGAVPRNVLDVGPLKGFNLTVHHRDGRKCELTEFGHAFLQPDKVGDMESVRIAPGADESVTIRCNQVYDMSMPDKYTIQFSRTVKSADGKTSVIVESEKIEVEVEQ